MQQLFFNVQYFIWVTLFDNQASSWAKDVTLVADGSRPDFWPWRMPA
jgi:hypothetical protein